MEVLSIRIMISYFSSACQLQLISQFPVSVNRQTVSAKTEFPGRLVRGNCIGPPIHTPGCFDQGKVCLFYVLPSGRRVRCIFMLDTTNQNSFAYELN